MATYTAPTTRTTGALISASIWNTDIVENLKYFKDAPVFDGAVKVTGALTPNTNDGSALGSATVSWADLFLASGGVINFNNGDVTVTHSSNTLTFAGAASGYVFNDGNVGIGTTPGTVKLDIVGSTDVIRVSSNATNATTKEGKFLQRHYTNSEEDLMVVYGYSTATDNGLAIGGGSASQNAATLITFYTAANTTTVAGTERMRIASSGIVTSYNYIIVNHPTNDAYIEFQKAGTRASIFGNTAAFTGVDGAVVYAPSGNAVNIYAGGSERMRITSGGNVAIAATAKLYLDGVAGTGNTYISEESGDVIALTAGGAVGVRVNPQGINTGTGSQSCNSGVATTLFSVSTKGLYEVFAYYGGASAIYLSCGRVMSDGAGYYRATFDNGAGLTLSLSTSNVQATQSSGGALTIQYRYVRISD